MPKKFKFLNDGPWIEPPNISEYDSSNKIFILRLLKNNLNLPDLNDTSYYDYLVEIIKQ